MDDDWDEFGDLTTTPSSGKGASSRPTSSSSNAKVKRPKTPAKGKGSSAEWGDDETSWRVNSASVPVASRPTSSSNKPSSGGGASFGRPQTSADMKQDPSAEWGDDEAEDRPRTAGYTASERTAKSPNPSSAGTPQENGWLDASLSQSTVDILHEADLWLADTETTTSRSSSAADGKDQSASGSLAAGSPAELKSRQGSRAGSRPQSRARTRTSGLRPESARSRTRALSPRPNSVAPAEVHVVDERLDLDGKSPSSSPRDTEPSRPGSQTSRPVSRSSPRDTTPSRPGSQNSRPVSRSSPRPSDDRAASAASQSSRSRKKGVFGAIADSIGRRNTSVMSLRAAGPGESVSNPRTPSRGSGGRPGTGLSGVSGLSSSSGCSSSSQRSVQAEVHFEVPLDKKYECPVCDQVLRFPVQFQECGHHVCSQCVPELFRSSGACPIDNKKISRDQAYPNKSLQQEIAALTVRCQNAVRGCTWRGRYDEHQSHDDSCALTTEACPNGCGADVEKRFLKSHVTNDCPKRGTPCDFCGDSVQQEDEIEHLKECRKFPMSCPNGCDAKELPREEIVMHTATECPKAFIPCPFAETGCEFEAERQHMLLHLEGTVAEHLEKVVRLTIENHRRVDIQAEALAHVGAEVEHVQDNIGSADRVNGCQLLWKITNYHEKFADARAGRRVTLYSPMFLTSRYGYKMAISVCPNGDGQGKGKFMSAFMCIIRGEFDALLPWPFAQKVTITVIDQCQDPAARKNIEYVIKPNTCKENMQFLGRPVHERNPSFGTQMFCPLAQLSRGDYIRDNTMFISVQVDNSSMPSIP